MTGLKSSTFLTLGIISFLTLGCSSDTPTFSVLPEENTFIQSSSEETYTKIDILWVVDNSGSMGTSQDNLAANFTSFINKFVANDYDYQIAVTTTEAYKGFYFPDYEADFSEFKEGHLDTDTGNYIHTNIKIIDKNTPNPEAVFLENMRQGTSGSGLERAFQSMEEALTSPLNAGFVRADSFLAVIIVSDEDDFSHPTYGWGPTGSTPDLPSFYNDADIVPTNYYLQFLEALTSSSGATKRFNVNSMSIWDEACRDLLNISWSGRKIGVRYGELVDATGGAKGDLCGDFATDLNFISEQILQLSTQFYLARTPKPETIQVYVDGLSIPNVSSNPGPLSGGWDYSPDANSIVFYGDYIPVQGATINVSFDTLTLEE